MKKGTIILANSVGIDRYGQAIVHSPSRWTSSSPNKDVFTYYPWELAYATTLLKRETDHTVKLIDGCLHKYDHAAYLNVIEAESPDYLVMEPSTRTWDEDRALICAVKKSCGAHVIVAGQHASAYPERVKEVADYVLIGEYEMTLLDIFQGKESADILGLYPNNRRELLDINYLPFPEDDDVSRLAYAIPGEPSSEYVEIQAYATRGCPFSCSFCVARNLYYAKPNWRARAVRNVVDELAYLKNKYPQMEGIFFDEEYHNVNKQFILDLTRKIKERQLAHLKIDAMCAYATLDREMMEAMKSAGYYLLRVGIETGAVASADGINLGKKHDVAKLKRILHDAKDIGLKMYGTFTFGAPGSTIDADAQTLALMEELIGNELLWRFQTSLCTPQPGTPYFSWAQEKGYLLANNPRDFDGGNFVAVEYPNYSREQIQSMYMKSQTYFDLALKNRFSHDIDKNLSQVKERFLGADTRVLLLRTSRSLQVNEAVRALRHINPDMRLDMLMQEHVQEEYKDCSSVNTVFTYENGFLSVDTFDHSLRAALAKNAYDHVIIIYGNSQGQGYANVHDVVRLIKGKHVMALNADGAVIDIT